MFTEAARGSCSCGAVEFEVKLPTKWCAHCHCEDCRRAHGAAFVTWFGVQRAGFEIVKGQARLVRHRSSEHAQRSFCGACGTTMLYEGDRWADEVHVALACMNDPIDRQPSASVYWDRRVAWGEGLEGLAHRGGASGTEQLDD